MKNIFKLAIIFLLAVNTFAAQQTINNGAFQGDTTAERAYTAFGKVNANFNELYAAKAQATNVGYVNIMWYGAKGDGVANDTTAFVNALSSGKDVYVPNGTYNIVSPITLPSKSVIYGDGPGSILLQSADMLHNSMFRAYDASDIRLSNLACVGNGQYNHIYSLATNHAVLYSSNSVVKVSGITISNQINGIMSEHPKALSIKNCDFQLPCRYGSVTNYLNYLTKDLQWYDTLTWQTLNAGSTTFQASTNITISDNVFAGNHVCIGFNTYYDTNFPGVLKSQMTAIVENNIINSYDRYGIMMYLFGNAPYNTPTDANGPYSEYYNCIIRNNILRNGSTLKTVLRTATASPFGAALYLHAQDGALIEGNQVYDCAQYMRAGGLGRGTIGVGFATGCRIINNIISNTPANGIVLRRTYGTRQNVIANNHIIQSGYVTTTGVAANGSATVTGILSTNGFLTNDVIYVFTNNVFTNATLATTKIVNYTADTITLANTLSFDGACTLVAPTTTAQDTGGIYICDNNNTFVHDNVIEKSYWNGIIVSGGTYSPYGVVKNSNITNSIVDNNYVCDVKAFGFWLVADYVDGCRMANNTVKCTGGYAMGATGKVLDNSSYINNYFDGHWRGLTHSNTNYQGLVVGNIFANQAFATYTVCIKVGSTNCYNNLYIGYGVVTNKY